MVRRLDLARREARAEQREKRECVREDREWGQKKRQEREHAPQPQGCKKTEKLGKEAGQT